MTLLQREIAQHREKTELYLNTLCGVGIVLLDPELKILDCNQGFMRIFHLRKKPIGSPVADFLILGDNDLKHAEELKLSCSRKSGVNGIVYCHAADTESGHLLFCERLILTESRAIEELGVINNELINLQRESVKKNLLLEKLRRELDERIAEIESTLEALRESEEKFRSLANATWEGIIIHREGIIMDANESASKILGYPVEQIIGKSIIDFLAPESVAPAMQKFREGIKHDQLYLEVKILRKDKTIISAEALGRPIRYNNIDARVLAFRDITDRKRAEEALRESEYMLRMIVNTVPQSIFWKDKASVYLGCNQVFSKAVGFADPE
ncbi:MAG: PAS domain S-box protein, partial [Syntrophales bacterium LBB04]|nr:PAS domain S-box protein [Syntrophales bacterium LBB04]